jgi:hypothetical protein
MKPNDFEKWFKIDGKRISGCSGGKDSVSFHTEDGLIFTVTATAYASIDSEGKLITHPSLALTIRKTE